MYKPRPKKPCPTCNQHFDKAKPQEVYCSLECAILPRIRMGDENECWPWTGGLAMGYGAGTFQKKRYKVSRFMLARKIGRPLTDSEQALHRCDNPACCNPAHLFPGTGADNMRDKVAKGRQRNGTPDLRGEKHPFAKLTRADVEFIWANQRSMRQVDLAQRFGVGRDLIWKILHGVAWRSVTDTLPVQNH